MPRRGRRGLLRPGPGVWRACQRAHRRPAPPRQAQTLGLGRAGRFRRRGFSHRLGRRSGGGRSRFLFGGALHGGLFLTAARLFGGGEDGNLLLLAAFRLALGFALRGQTLFGQHALARRDFRGSQSAAARDWARPRTVILGRRGGPLGRGFQRRARRGCGRCGRRRRRTGRQATLLAHLDLHHFRAAMREALPHGSGIDGMSRIATRCRAQGKPAFGFSLVVAVTHA